MTHDDLARDLQSLRERAREASNAFEDVAIQEHLHRKLTQNLDTIIEALRSFSGEGEQCEGHISHEEAKEIALRLIRGSFRRDGERLADGPRFSIPTRPNHDDDCRIVGYIKQQAALSSLKTAPDGWRLVPVETIELIYRTMNHMGDVLNGMDAVTEDDVELATPAFDAVRSLLALNEDMQEAVNG